MLTLHFTLSRCVSLSHKYIMHHTTVFTAFPCKKNSFKQTEERNQEKELNATLRTSWDNWVSWDNKYEFNCRHIKILEKLFWLPHLKSKKINLNKSKAKPGDKFLFIYSSDLINSETGIRRNGTGHSEVKGNYSWVYLYVCLCLEQHKCLFQII